ncbi:MAG: hypothetical protein AUJ08_07740 [Thaumarchaeota archaeon 13_1_40CM_3_50_5]|nr:MAG: hypothetical protein AUJ08_07740 [Thaumarchaeota archaeon 13_1_40CM_3_50_5]
MSAYAHAKLLLANDGQKHGIEKGLLLMHYKNGDTVNLSIAQDENSFIVCWTCSSYAPQRPLWWSGKRDTRPSCGRQSTASQSHIFRRCTLAIYPSAPWASYPALVFARGALTLAFYWTSEMARFSVRFAQLKIL